MICMKTKRFLSFVIAILMLVSAYIPCVWADNEEADDYEIAETLTPAADTTDKDIHLSAEDFNDKTPLTDERVEVSNENEEITHDGKTETEAIDEKEPEDFAETSAERYVDEEIPSVEDSFDEISNEEAVDTVATFTEEQTEEIKDEKETDENAPEEETGEAYSSEDDDIDDTEILDAQEHETAISEEIEEPEMIGYEWSVLSDDAFISWVTDPCHADYIIALFASDNAECLALRERIDNIEDASLRETVYTYIDSLLKTPEESADSEFAVIEADATESGEENGAAEVSEDTEEQLTETEDCQFPGPAADFSLTRKQYEEKEALNKSGAASRVKKLTEGKDYAANTLIFTYDDRDYAFEVARIYDAELTDMDFGIATITLRSGTVAQAVSLAADLNNDYPPVEPDWIIPFIEEPDLPAFKSKSLLTAEVPVSEDWNSWVNAENAILSDPDLYLQDPSSDSYQWQHDMMNTYAAWGVTTGSNKITVAVIDSGVKASHVDLHNVSIETVGGISADPRGSHATHVAGIIAATLNNGNGGAGIAPGVNILSIRVVDNNDSIKNSNLAKAILAVVNKDNNNVPHPKADIINISIGGADHSTVLENALSVAYAAGITIVASAGNNGDNSMMYPAGYSTVIAVGNVDRTGYRAPSSTYGTFVDISAPGQNIMSTSLNGYTRMSGTSMASPMVAGAAALYMSRVGHVSPQKMKAVLKASVSKCYSSGMGAGIIDVSKMFLADKTAPAFSVDNKAVSGTVKAKASSTLRFTGLNSDGAVIYTLDGTVPTIANGYVKNGIVCEKEGILVGDLGAVGTTWTIKAAFVSNLGARSNVATLKITVTGSNAIEALHISAPSEFKAGRSVKLGINAEPIYASDAVIWSISARNGCPTVTISDIGSLHAYSTDFGTVTVRATSAVDASVFDEAEIFVKSIDLVKSISLPKTASLMHSNGVKTSKQLSVKFKTKSGTIRPLAPTGSYEGIQAAWSSSNKKAVIVDENGKITAVGKGTAKITCRALDGSGITKTCSVTVRRGADAIEINGQSAVAAGTSAIYKASVTPASTANKSVTWYLENAPEGASISSKGKLYVSAGTAETEFYVYAKTKDGSEVIDKTAVRIVPRVSSLKLALPPNDQGVRYTTYRGALKTMTLYTVDRPNSGRTENSVDLDYICTGSEHSLRWNSSNSSVASVDQNGVVTAHKKGTATISVRANDGSGKKASVTVSVKIPASSLTIVPARQMPNGECYIGVGCSVSNKAKTGTGFGTSDSAKVTWSIESVITVENNELTDITDLCKSKKWITVSSAGTIKVSRYAVSYVKSHVILQLTVRAFRAEEGLEAFYKYYIIPKVTTLSPTKKTMRLEAQKGDGSVSYDIALLNSNSVTDACFTVSSSNQSIAGASMLYDVDLDVYYIRVFANQKRGTATITVKANDGSGKSTSIKVYVD